MAVSSFNSRGNTAVGRFREKGRLFPPALVILAVIICLSAGIEAGSRARNPVYSSDSSGVLATYNTTGGIDLANPFFQNLGTNGRTCGTCHVSQDGWTVTPPHIQERFNASDGTDPLFRPVDGANCPSADVSTVEARREAYSLLLAKGLIRVSISVPPNAQFSITQIQDPQSCPQTTAGNPALYRRPLPATNLGFLSAVMWDGRETVDGNIPGKSLNLTQSLSNQAQDATTGHAQAKTPPTAEELAAIVVFETGNFTAQSSDNAAGPLTANRAQGGPVNLSGQPFYIGINDALGGDPTGAPFNPSVFTLYESWANLKGHGGPIEARRSVARGQTLFNTLPISITGVRGLPDRQGTCTTCHDTPNVGNHSFSVPLAIGTTDYPAPAALDISGLPVYTVSCSDGTSRQVTDLGRAMISGKCADVGKVKGPILRGLAGRAPYFHNGSAATLNDVVEFYSQRFDLNLTEQQKADLVAFLQTL
jgi:cytochrome c peroxidase